MKAQLIKRIDKRLVNIAKTIKILSAASWHPSQSTRFLEAYRKGKKILPNPKPKRLDMAKKRTQLKELIKLCDRNHPIGNFLFQTAQNYKHAAEMVEKIGTARYSALSQELFGSPYDSIDGGELTTFDAAAHFLAATKEFREVSAVQEQASCLLPEHVANVLQQRANKLFKNDPISVVVDPQLMSRAAAGARRIRIRGATYFAENDINQLLEHEAFVHSLTGINGRHQTVLTSLSLNAPRVTATQEGLAVFAELITNSMDLSRLQRISLRVKAIQMGLDGADFIEVFEFFIESGISEFESFQSAARIFRGGNVRGGNVCTKDVVYLKGFVEVHSFLLAAMQSRKFMYPSYLCAGKMATADVALFEEFFENGLISMPMYEPGWIQNRSSLLAFLLYSTFVTQLRVQQPKIELIKKSRSKLNFGLWT